MRAITVRQPWAWAIVHGGKDVENRSRNIAGAYRGPVAIHAGQQYAKDADLDPTFLAAWVPVGGDLDYGHIIGVVELADVHHGWMEPQGRPCSPWGQDYDGAKGLHHLVLRNPRPLAEPVRYRGALGLWTVPEDVEARIREQVPL